MNPYLLTLFVFLFLSLSTAAQSFEREVFPRQVSIDHNDAVRNFSADYVSFFEDLFWFNQGFLNVTGNTAYVDIDGSENVTMLSQRGYGITGIMDVNGSGNLTTMEQNGFNLISILNIDGNSNQFDLTQEGAHLQNQFHIYGSGADMEAQQTNSGMNYRQTGAGIIPLSIQQSGRTTPVIIRNY